MGLFSSRIKQNTIKKHPKTTSSSVSDKDLAILELKNARDRLKRTQARLDSEVQESYETARKLVQENKKDRAKMVLKLKKLKEQQIQKIDEHLFNTLKLIDTVEWETQQFKVFEGLKAGNSALCEIHKEMTIEAVETLMLDTIEAQELTNRIGEIIGSVSPVDEDSIMEDLHLLEQLEAQEIDALMPKAPVDAIQSEPSVLQKTALRKQKQAKPVAIQS